MSHHPPCRLSAPPPQAAQCVYGATVALIRDAWQGALVSDLMRLWGHCDTNWRHTLFGVCLGFHPPIVAQIGDAPCLTCISYLMPQPLFAIHLHPGASQDLAAVLYMQKPLTILIHAHLHNTFKIKFRTKYIYQPFI
jgi:hypothetical protein